MLASNRSGSYVFRQWSIAIESVAGFQGAAGFWRAFQFSVWPGSHYSAADRAQQISF
jgi:Zn-dependent protease